MSEGFSGLFRGIRPVDGVLAGTLTALGIWLMVENVLFPDTKARRLSHCRGHHGSPDDVSLLVHGPGLRPRVGSAAVVAAQRHRRDRDRIGGDGDHDLIFGWVTRCGAGLPLAFVLAYLGAVACERRRSWISMRA